MFRDVVHANIITAMQVGQPSVFQSVSDRADLLRASLPPFNLIVTRRGR